MLKLNREILEEIPKIDAVDAEYTEAWCYFANIHVNIDHISLEEYKHFLVQLSEHEFQEVTNVENGLRDLVYNAVFQKAEKTLYLMYIPTSKRIYMSYGVDPYRPSWTGSEVFAKVPKVYTHELEWYTPEDYGAGNYVVEQERILFSEYQAYCSKLEECGFAKFASNDEGINGEVFCANYDKGNLYVTVVYVANLKKLYVSACFDQPFSSHLLYDESYVEGNVDGAKTTLHMLKLNGGGNSFVWKLKNGHFLISDGGLPCDTDILYEYLESETPEGEKPIVEGWFITHGHVDHCGPFECIANQAEKYADRIIVEGIYYNEPNDLVMSFDPAICKASTTLIKDAQKVLRTSEGKCPLIYRTQTGQRYYFNDMIVDIVVGQEQIPFKHYAPDLNDSSTWCMFQVEGQKCLFGGDGDRGGMKFIMCAYDQEYMDVDIFTLLHHGHNTRDFFTDFCKVKTTLVTHTAAQNGILPASREKENAYLKANSKEWYSWLDGTKVLTFPYEIGSYETR
jgi:beta-lactamase superfamily II metal-dependent hydrolase